MSANVKLIGEIENVLEACAAAGHEMTQLTGNTDYLAGFAACHRIFALAFGINSAQMIPNTTTAPQIESENW